MENGAERQLQQWEEEARSSGTHRSVRVSWNGTEKGTQETSTWNSRLVPLTPWCWFPSHPSELELGHMGALSSFRWVTWEGTAWKFVEINSKLAWEKKKVGVKYPKSSPLWECVQHSFPRNWFLHELGGCCRSCWVTTGRLCPLASEFPFLEI